MTSTKPALYDALRLTYDAALEDTVVTGLTVSTVTSASEAMQSFARACQAASAGTGECCVFCIFFWSENVFLWGIYPWFYDSSVRFFIDSFL